ncbi:unnamed protein product [Trichogramma brassicae]|uniref:G-protein coupled receptors family 1 profile domain-containing protein n=1 Tax=Trichogramma brassicae TaxID=86971 RepID=A0A6H5J5Q3_9HYME|nr:unnamed protein product [Trichogramma brassicae]
MSGPEDCALKSLHDAVEWKDLDSLESLLKGGVDPNSVDDKGMTALNKICESVRLHDVHVTMVRALLRYKADVNIESQEDMSPLSNLFQGGNNHRLRVEIFKLLLEHGANVDRVDFDRDTILHLIFRSDAWRPNLMEAVELLLFKCRIDVNAKNVNGHTPLHVAVGHCIDAKAIELLLKNGANPNIVDLRGMAPINSICAEPDLSAYHLQIVQLLVRHRANLDIRNNEGYTPMMDLLRSTESHKWRLQIFKLLVDSGANARLAQTAGLNTIGHYVFHTYAKSPNIVPTVEQLLKSGVDLNAQNKKGWTALHFAATRCQTLEPIELLLKNGADPNLYDGRRRTVLHWIGRLRSSLESQKFTGHHIKMIELLVEHGADLRLRDGKLNCPRVELLLGARDEESRSKLYSLFLKYDPDNIKPAKYTRMLLHNIFDVTDDFSSIEKLAEFLIRYAGNVNEEDKKGRVLLHGAVNMLRADHVEFLLNNGADANQHDDNGSIALNFCSTLWDQDEIGVADLERYLKILRLNVENEAELSHLDIFGKTVLHQLIAEFSLYSLKPREEGHLALVWTYVQRYIEILLENGLDIDVKDRDLSSPLDVAVSHCNYQVAKFLVDSEANLLVVRFSGGYLEHEVPEALNLTTTLNVLAIMELWQSQGVQINKQQYLRLFKFLTLYQDFDAEDDRFMELFKYWYANFPHGPTVPLCNYPYWHDIYNYDFLLHSIETVQGGVPHHIQGNRNRDHIRKGNVSSIPNVTVVINYCARTKLHTLTFMAPSFKMPPLRLSFYINGGEAVARSPVSYYVIYRIAAKSPHSAEKKTTFVSPTFRLCLSLGALNHESCAYIVYTAQRSSSYLKGMRRSLIRLIFVYGCVSLVTPSTTTTSISMDEDSNDTADASYELYNGTNCENFLNVVNSSIKRCVNQEEFVTAIYEYIYPRPYEWLLIAMHCLVFVVGLVGNFMVCMAIYRNHTMRNVTNYFIVNLAVADLLVIIVCLPPTVVWDVTETWFFGMIPCKIVLYFQLTYTSAIPKVFTYALYRKFYNTRGEEFYDKTFEIPRIRIGEKLHSKSCGSQAILFTPRYVRNDLTTTTTNGSRYRFVIHTPRMYERGARTTFLSTLSISTLIYAGA